MKDQSVSYSSALVEAAEANEKRVAEVLAGSALVPRAAREALNGQAVLIRRMAEVITQLALK